MKWNDRLPWKIYLFLVGPAYLTNFISVFEPGSPLYAYYHILMAFDKDYRLLYFLNIASAAVNMFSLVPLFLYSFRGYFLPAKFWQRFFFLRIFFECTGHAYEFNFVKAMLHFSDIYTLPTLALTLVLIIPSYIAGYKYAFVAQEDLFKK